jgi:hypothetical protein
MYHIATNIINFSEIGSGCEVIFLILIIKRLYGQIKVLAKRVTEERGTWYMFHTLAKGRRQGWSLDIERGLL